MGSITSFIIELTLFLIPVIALYYAIYFEHKHRDGTPEDYALPSCAKWLFIMLIFQLLVLEDYFTLLPST